MLGLYQYLKKDAQKVIYFTNDEFIPLEYVEILQHASNNINDNITFLQRYGIKVLIVDNYAVSEEQIYLLNKNFHLIFFDSEFNNYKIEAIINFNPFSVQMYPQKHAETNYFLGLEYMFYRDSMMSIKKIDEEENSVFICIGGSDVDEMTYKLISFLSNVFSYHIVLGKGCSKKYYKKMRKYLLQKGFNFVLYHQPDDFFNILAKCQFAITSCSTTIYELFYFDKPFICINVIENQNMLTRYLKEHGIITFTSESAYSLKGTMEKKIFKRLKLPKNSSQNKKLLNYVKDLI